MIYFQLFSTFLRIGAFTLGGGYAMVPLIQREVVDKRHWIDEETFLDMLAIAQSAPGIIAVNTAFFVGYSIRGWRGATCAILGAVIPSFIAILLIAILFSNYHDHPYVEAIFRGIRPAVVALIVAPLWKMSRTAYRSASESVVSRWTTIALCLLPLVALLMIWLVRLSPVWVILATMFGATIWTYISNKTNKRP